MTGPASWVMVTAMDRDRAIEALPTPYGEVVRLVDGGVSAAVAAERLGLDADTASTLVAVAEGKLAELLAAPEITEPTTQDDVIWSDA